MGSFLASSRIIPFGTALPISYSSTAQCHTVRQFGLGLFADGSRIRCVLICGSAQSCQRIFSCRSRVFPKGQGIFPAGGGITTKSGGTFSAGLRPFTERRSIGAGRHRALFDVIAVGVFADDFVTAAPGRGVHTDGLVLVAEGRSTVILS